MPMIFYGYSSTVYLKEEGDKETLISWIVDASRFFKIGFIRNYICCNRDDGTLVECKDINDLHQHCLEIRKAKNNFVII
jgi:hypothetical protein